SEREVVGEKGVEDVGPVEERRSVVEVEVVAGGMVFGGVLYGADIVERLGASVVQVEDQSMPIVVAEGDNEGVVVGVVVTVTHEEVEDLEVVIGLQPEDKLPVYVYRVKKARDVIVDEIDGVARSDASSGGNVGAIRSASNPKTGELVFKPRLICDGSGRNSAPELRRHRVVSLSKDLTGGLVF